MGVSICLGGRRVLTSLSSEKFWPLLRFPTVRDNKLLTYCFYPQPRLTSTLIMAASFKMLSRGFSSTASMGQLVKTPTQVFGTEGRYAAALYSAATKQKALAAV